VLRLGEPGYEKDTGRLKIGDGVTPWNSLDYFSNGAAIDPEVIQDILGDNFIIGGGGIGVEYDDNGDSLTISVSGNYVAATGTLDVLGFNTNIEPDLIQGQIGWNNTEGTINIALTNDTDIHVGEHSFYRVRNETGSPLYKGQAVYASGVHANGIITPELYAADGAVREIRFIGLMLENLNNNNNGYAIQFGHIENIDTRGNVASNISVGDETWVDGDILYVHPTVPGKLTKNEPKHSIAVAIILDAANNGRIFVRPTSYGHLDDNHDVDISGATNGQFLQYNSVTDYWVPSSSGNFSALLVNGTGVSVSGHTHTSSEITDFNSSVSGLLPTVTNSGDNRILTSDGTSTGINAESNFTYNPTTGITNISTSGLNNNLQLFQNSSDTVGQSPRINLRKNRGSSDSEMPLQSGDFIGLIAWTTLDDSNSNSVAAQISAITPEGLSNYTHAPTQIRITNRTTDGSLSNIFVNTDGTLNPTAGMIISDNAKGVAFTDTRATAVQTFNITSLNDNENCEARLDFCVGETANTSTVNSVVGSNCLAIMTIPSGVSNSGVLVGQSVGAYRNILSGYEDDGSLFFLVGQNINYGHSVVADSTTTSTSIARGVSVTPLAGKGTITAAYDIFLANTIYDQVIDASGTIKSGDGTITSRYGIYQESADPNYFAGSLTVASGLSSPTPIFSLGAVSGNVSINYDIDKQIQTLTLNGTTTNFIEGSGWPSTTSVDVLLEITVNTTTTVSWTLVDDQYNPFPTFTAGKYLILIRNFGTTIQGHYIGEKTN
jgi:hypothetical protein